MGAEGAVQTGPEGLTTKLVESSGRPSAGSAVLEVTTRASAQHLCPIQLRGPRSPLSEGVATVFSLRCTRWVRPLEAEGAVQTDPEGLTTKLVESSGRPSAGSAALKVTTWASFQALLY